MHKNDINKENMLCFFPIPSRQLFQGTYPWQGGHGILPCMLKNMGTMALRSSIRVRNFHGLSSSSCQKLPKNLNHTSIQENEYTMNNNHRRAIAHTLRRKSSRMVTANETDISKILLPCLQNYNQNQDPFSIVENGWTTRDKAPEN